VDELNIGKMGLFVNKKITVAVPVFTGHCSSFIVHCSLFIVHRSLYAIFYAILQ